MGDTGPPGRRPRTTRGLGSADRDDRFGVAEEVRHLVTPVRGVERQEHRTGANDAEVREQRLG